MPPKKKPSTLRGFEKNVHSQFGEDGIIQEILRRLETRNVLNGWCVEFGAWDGVHLSNTCRLIREKDYAAVLVEGNRARVAELNKNFPSANVHKISRFVTFEGQDTLDEILSETPIPADFDFLSIDVDGADYHILESLRSYRPKVVCVEFNPTIPPFVDYVQRRDFSLKHGSSARALIRLGRAMGYEAVYATHANLFLVRNDFTQGMFEPLNFPADGSNEGYPVLFVGYDGTILSTQDYIKLPWHGISVPLRELQALPRPLRVFAGDYGPPRKLLFWLWNRFRVVRARFLGG
jgi:hypothetical protein